MKRIALNIGEFELKPFDTGFRVIVDYNPGTDTLLTRLDIKIGDRRYCTGFFAEYPSSPPPGTMIKNYDELIIPSKVVDQCLNIKVAKSEILRALKELVNDIETDKP